MRMWPLQGSLQKRRKYLEHNSWSLFTLNQVCSTRSCPTHHNRLSTWTNQNWDCMPMVLLVPHKVKTHIWSLARWSSCLYKKLQLVWALAEPVLPPSPWMYTLCNRRLKRVLNNSKIRRKERERRVVGGKIKNLIKMFTGQKMKRERWNFHTIFMWMITLLFNAQRCKKLNEWWSCNNNNPPYWKTHF
jgi:hypothetical protein